MVLLLQVRLIVFRKRTDIFGTCCADPILCAYNRRKIYNVCFHYNDLVQKVTLKCLNTSFVN